MDKLQVLQKLASKERFRARIFKAIADPPTTSLQRLKGLTTGGLPTFIDVGNSFGAPAIVEDNLILQVDNGVIEHLMPSLLKEDWDVLIAHFLGVDHAGHIHGVHSSPMIAKLEQYNTILEEVVDVLKNYSGPGGLHENTLLLVMGDHGQTLNGDHGGGTAEEVETSLFAMSLRNHPAPASCVLDKNFHNIHSVQLKKGIFWRGKEEEKGGMRNLILSVFGVQKELNQIWGIEQGCKLNNLEETSDVSEVGTVSLRADNVASSVGM
ncbi:hypothetical protein HPP92_010574 [Vanilla planifolia]|uniref:GPI ethanolamine phosphate transferase 3 n=1 Tax=Vanilla planifolia TaxID=51239 RepID=A0A835QYW2_VANPL|nr:hypothetical protein HPP92_010574 [Vanilla planifolia]